MTVNDWLRQATKELADTGTSRLDALVLLGDELNKNSAQLLASPEQDLPSEQQQRLKERVERRKQHEPLAYIRQRCEFYGREFYVNKSVLIPRPETETMIELLKQLPKAAQQIVVDVGTGSGAIAITVACELHEVQVLASDIDQRCLNVVQRNSKKHQVTVGLIKANLLAGVELPPGTTILANLPYVPDEYSLNQAALQEPKLAIFGGQDGLDLYRQMFVQLKNHKGYVLTESLPFQHSELTQVAKKVGYQLKTTDDFIQVFLKS